MTTNGLRLAGSAVELREAGIDSVNISLDTLDAERFRDLTGVDGLRKVLKAIEASIAAGLFPVKLNVVLLRGTNEDELADLVRFAHAMRVGEIVREETCERMWTRQETALGEETDYGFGWFIGTAGGGRRIVRHGGAQTGATASLVYFVDDDVVVAMLCNSEWCDPPPIVVPLLRMLVRSRR